MIKKNIFIRVESEKLERLCNIQTIMTDQYNTGLPIKMWAEADRPREKMALKGKAQLSDAELLAIILGSGSRDETALDLSKRILASVDNNLNALGKLDLASLRKFKGVGVVKAITLSAALELGRRRQSIQIDEKPKITCSRDVYNIMHGQLTDLPHEEFWILLVNRANIVEHKIMISKGGVAGTVVDNKIIFKYALNHLSSSIVLVHNHPSTNLKPSKADLNITKKIVTSAKMLDINVLDHVIIGGDNYFSFADEDLI